MTQTAHAPSIVLYNGTVVTLDPLFPHVQAISIEKGKIRALGMDVDVFPLASPNTEKIDLDGRMVVPGFFDSHIHFYEWAMQRQGIRLDDITRLEELVTRVREAAFERPPGHWIIGQGWNETDWVEPRMPNRELLDRVAPDHPVLLWRCDMHLAAVNSAALKLARITYDTPDPPKGRIERDAGGAPTGILRELAINLVREVVAPPDGDQVVDAFEEAAKALHRRGITAIHDIRLMKDSDGAGALRAFQKLDQENRLELRSWVALSGHHLDHIIGLGLRSGFGNERLRLGHVKYFSDGGMGARTAWLIEPYLDAEYGMPLMDMELLAQQIKMADDAGLSVMVHAVGDRANRELINIFEGLASRRSVSGSSPPAFAHRIEHVQMIRPEDVRRLQNLNLALCVNPSNLVLDINLIDQALGKNGKWTYSFRTLLDAGVPVMFSSDCPVCDPDPLLGIHAAATRQRMDGTPKGGWYPDSVVTTAEALKAYTKTPAAVHRAHGLGSISPGKWADLAVLSGNILTVPPSQLGNIGVDMTVFNGRIVYRGF